MLKVPRLMLKNVKKYYKPGHPRYRVAKFHSTPKLNSPRKLVHLRKLQGDYQCEDGRPIFLKSGFKDRLLYTTTLVLCAAGVFNTLLVIYNHAKPPGWKTKC